MSNYQEPVSMVTIPLIECQNLKACEKALEAEYCKWIDNDYHRHEVEVEILTKDETIKYLAEQVKSFYDSSRKYYDSVVDLTNKINKK